MRIRNAALGVAAVLGMAQFASATQIVSAVGVFDPVFNGPVNGQTNPSVSSGVFSNEAGMTVATWQGRIGAAYANGLGGVWNGSDGTLADTTFSGNAAADTVWRLTTAPGKSFQTSSTTAIQPLGLGSIPPATAWGSMNAISGYRFIAPVGSNPQAGSWAMSFAPVGYDASAKITELGFAYIGRSGTVGTVVSFTATYDDLTTAVNTFAPLAQGNAAFVHFLAPAGRSITTLGMTINGTRGAQVDDLGVVISVPEPASAALLGVALMGLAVRRRKA